MRRHVLLILMVNHMVRVLKFNDDLDQSLRQFDVVEINDDIFQLIRPQIQGNRGILAQERLNSRLAPQESLHSAMVTE